MRRTVGLCLAVLLILSLTACDGTAPVSSDLTDMSDVFVGDTVTTDVPPATTTTTVPPTTTTTAPLTAEQKRELQIKQDFLAWIQANGYNADKTINDVTIHKKHGVWNGALALSIGTGNGGGLTAARYHKIVGNKYTGGYLLDALHLYKGEEFKTLDDAYNSGWVTQAEVGEILRLVLNNYDRQVLDNKVIHQAIAFLNEQYPDGSDLFGDVSSLTVMDVDVQESSSEKHDGFALYHVSVNTFFSAPGFINRNQMLTDIELAGYTFSINRERWALLFIYKDGLVKHLPQAYEAGWLDKNEVYTILQQAGAEFK